MRCAKCKNQVIAVRFTTRFCIACEAEGEGKELDALEALNEVTLTPEQFEAEAIELSKRLQILEEPYQQTATEKEFIDSMIERLGPQFSVAVLEQVVDHYKAQIKEIKEQRFVAMLKTINARKWVSATNGMEVELKKKISVSTADCDKALLAGWLEAHGLGYLITDNLAFEKGQLTPEIVGELRDRGLQFYRNSEVSTASLKPALVEREKSGADLPPAEACKMSIFELAEVKYQKDKKKK